MELTAVAAAFRAAVDLCSGSTLVFGSQQHRWEVQSPLSEPALAQVEAALGPLPEEARTWFSTVSSGGAGPAYGLLSPGAAPGADPFAVFSATKPRTGHRFDGCFPLADEGGGDTTVLVLAGKRRGEVWTVRSTGARSCQASRFSAWIDAWIRSAVVGWAEGALDRALVAAPPVLLALEGPLKARVEAGHATEADQVALVGICGATGRRVEALRWADEAAAAFEDPDEDDEDTIEAEREARRRLWRAQVHRHAGDLAQARAELEATAEVRDDAWVSTQDAIDALMNDLAR